MERSESFEENKPFTGELQVDDVLGLYRRGMAAQQLGCYREAFRCYKAVLPFVGTYALIWIRITEVTIHALFGKCDITKGANLDASHIVGEGKSRRVLLPSSRISIAADAYERDGMTLSFAGQSSQIAVNLLTNTSNVDLYKHALNLSCFVFLQQGRLSPAHSYAWDLILKKEGSQLENLRSSLQSMIYRMEILIRDGGTRKTLQDLKELSAGDLQIITESPKITQTLAFNTAVACIAMKQYELALDAWKTLSLKKNQDVRCMGVYIYAKMGKLDEARNLVFA